MKKKLFKIYLDIMQMLQGVSRFVFIVASFTFLINNSDLLAKLFYLEFGVHDTSLLIISTSIFIVLAVSIGNLAIKEFFSFLMPSFFYDFDTTKCYSVSISKPIINSVSTSGQYHRSNSGMGGSWENNDNNSGAIQKNFFSQLNTPALNKKLEAYTKEVQRLENKVWNLSYEIEIKSYILFMVGDALHNLKYYNQRQSETPNDNLVVSMYHAEIISDAGRFLRCISRGCNNCGSHHYKLDVEYDGFKYGTNNDLKFDFRLDRDCESYSLTQLDNILFIIDILIKAAHNLEFKEHEVVMIEEIFGIKKETIK